MSHCGTGIDLSAFGDEVSITVPYWHVGDGAATVLGKLFALSTIVEKETGLTASLCERMDECAITVECLASLAST
ncbi:hypothetical protein PV342_16340 [Streptomyces sp. PA03-3a]|nr:hypothetical protein [Streptomyces sp. PA03-3a]